ncbi:MAG: HAMP domain-containing protein, partial [Deltaproteobacteria bacterium]|nr:HAMP domain-containing protein [Deltaproteobacteria bacterium]
MANTAGELVHMVELHEVQGLRHELVIDALEVQTDLQTAHTAHAQDRDLIFSNLEKLKEASEECLSCHHPPELEDKLSRINSLVAEYEGALQTYLMASADDPLIETLETYPASILEKIFLQSDEMSREASTHLEEISEAATERIKKARLILLVTLSLALCLGLIIAQRLVQMLTYPIEKLVEATEIIAAGGIGHQIEHAGQAEFGQLTQHFNVMSRSLEGNIEALRLKNEDLQQAITKWEQAEQEKEILQRQLLFTQKMEAVSTLSAGVAHEFNN